jgi:aconitate hydratase
VALLGVKAVVESFERAILDLWHGVRPLELAGARRGNLRLDGSETFDVTGLSARLGLRTRGKLHVHRTWGATETFDVVVRIDTTEEIACYTHGGILPMVYRETLAAARH